MDFDGAATGAKAWKDIWGAGQGVGAVKKVVPVSALVGRLSDEYQAAKARVCG
jgi:nitronate monooxygenase